MKKILIIALFCIFSIVCVNCAFAKNKVVLGDTIASITDISAINTERTILQDISINDTNYMLISYSNSLFGRFRYYIFKYDNNISEQYKKYGFIKINCLYYFNDLIDTDTMSSYQIENYHKIYVKEKLINMNNDIKDNSNIIITTNNTRDFVLFISYINNCKSLVIINTEQSINNFISKLINAQ